MQNSVTQAEPTPLKGIDVSLGVPDSSRARIGGEEGTGKGVQRDAVCERSLRERFWAWMSPQLVTAVGCLLSPVLAAIVTLSITDRFRDSTVRLERRSLVAAEVWFRTENYLTFKKQHEREAKWWVAARKTMDQQMPEGRSAHCDFSGQDLVTLLWQLNKLTSIDEKRERVRDDLVAFGTKVEEPGLGASEAESLDRSVAHLRETLKELIPDVVLLSAAASGSPANQKPAESGASKELPEATRERIRSEELYRREVRSRLVVKDSLLWLACIGVAVVIALAYVHYAKHRQMKTDSRASARKLALEVAFRTEVYQKIKEEDPEESASAARKALDGKRDVHVIYPEFAGRPLISLLWELARVCDEEKTGNSLMVEVNDLRVTKSLKIRKDLPEERLDKQVHSLRVTLAEFLEDSERRSQSAAGTGETSAG